MVTKFTPENRATIVASVRVGIPFAAAGEDLGIRVKTGEGWLTRGRREVEGPYAEFAGAVDLARAGAPGMSRDHFEACLTKSVRAGSVQAMKLWWDIHGKTKESDAAADADPFDGLQTDDELAKRRGAKA